MLPPVKTGSCARCLTLLLGFDVTPRASRYAASQPLPREPAVTPRTGRHPRASTLLRGLDAPKCAPVHWHLQTIRIVRSRESCSPRAAQLMARPQRKEPPRWRGTTAITDRLRAALRAGDSVKLWRPIAESFHNGRLSDGHLSGVQSAGRVRGGQCGNRPRAAPGGEEATLLPASRVERAAREAIAGPTEES